MPPELLLKKGVLILPLERTCSHPCKAVSLSQYGVVLDGVLTLIQFSHVLLRLFIIFPFGFPQEMGEVCNYRVKMA